MLNINANIIGSSGWLSGASGAELIMNMIADSAGAWWDTSDIATLFQNTAGTTPVTAAGQTVRCIKDKSGNGWHLTNSVGDLYQVDSFGNGYVALSGTTGQSWTTTSSTAGFKFLHDGTGGSLITVFEKSPDVAAARILARTGTTTGMEFNVTGAGIPQITVFASSATVVTQVNPVVSPFGPGARRVHMIALSSTSLKQYCDGVSEYRTTNNSGTPSTANSNQSFFIGSTTKGNFFSMAAIGQIPSLSDWSTISNYLNSTHGRPVPAWDTPFVIGGQSNAEGSNTMTAISEPVSVNIAMYDKADRLRVANEPIHDRINWIATTLTGGLPVSHSFALKAAKDIYSATSGTVKPIIVPGAVGGTSISNWMPTANRVDRLTLYGSVNARLIALNAMTANTPVFLWFGHEADVNLTSENLATGAFGTGYMSAFKGLMDAWRVDYPNSPIIFCQISVNNTASAATRRAQESLRRCEASYGGSFAISNSYMVVTHDLKRNASPDGVHLSEESQIEVGRRIALAYRGGVLGESINWQGPRLVSITKPAAAQVKVKFSRTINDNLNNFGTLFRVYSDGVEHTVNSAVRDSGDDTAVLLTLSANHSGLVLVTYGERNTADNIARADVVIDSDNLPAPNFGPVEAA